MGAQRREDDACSKPVGPVEDEAGSLNPQMPQIDSEGERDKQTDLVVEALVPRACG
jgi:hypothetical protein